MYPVIVIGPPRSGTTMVAQVLNDFFGILMDGSPIPPPQHLHKFRWFEDKRLIEMNWLYSNKMISLNAWKRRFKRFVRSMSKHKEWGFKDPRLIPMLSHVLSYFKHPTIIRVHREKELVVKSWVEKFKWPEEESYTSYDRQESILNFVLKHKPHYRVNFGKTISEEQVIELLKGSMILHAA